MKDLESKKKSIETKLINNMEPFYNINKNKQRSLKESNKQWKIWKEKNHKILKNRVPWMMQSLKKTEEKIFKQKNKMSKRSSTFEIKRKIK